MRDVVYFHGHGMTHAMLVLGIYAVLGAATVIIVQIIRARSRPATASVRTASSQEDIPAPGPGDPAAQVSPARSA